VAVARFRVELVVVGLGVDHGGAVAGAELEIVDVVQGEEAAHGRIGQPRSPRRGGPDLPVVRQEEAGAQLDDVPLIEVEIAVLRFDRGGIIAEPALEILRRPLRARVGVRPLQLPLARQPLDHLDRQAAVARVVVVADPEDLVEEKVVDEEVGLEVRLARRGIGQRRFGGGGRQSPRLVDRLAVEVAQRVVDVDVLQLLAVLARHVGDRQGQLGGQLPLEAERQLVAPGRLQPAVDLRRRRRRLRDGAPHAAVGNPLPGHAVGVEQVVAVDGVGPLLADDGAEEQLVVVAPPGREDLGAPVEERVPGHRQAGGQVVVGEAERLLRLGGDAEGGEGVGGDLPPVAQLGEKTPELRRQDVGRQVVARQPRQGGAPQRFEQVRNHLLGGGPIGPVEEGVGVDALADDAVVVPREQIVLAPLVAPQEVEAVEELLLLGRVERRVAERIGRLAIEAQPQPQAEVREGLPGVLEIDAGRQAGRFVLHGRLGRQDGPDGAEPLPRVDLERRDDGTPPGLAVVLLPLQHQAGLHVVAAVEIGDEQGQVLAQREALALVVVILVIRAGGAPGLLVDGVEAVGRLRRPLAVGVVLQRVRRVVEVEIAVAILRAGVQAAVAVPVLAQVEHPVAVVVLRLEIEVTVAVRVLPRHALAPPGRRLATVLVAILEQAVEGAERGEEILEDVERAVIVEVLPPVVFARLAEAVAVAVGPESAVAVGVRVEGRELRRALVERRHRGLERHVGAEDPDPLAGHHEPSLVQDVAALLAREAVQPLVLELLRIVVDRQGQAVVRCRLPGELGELAELLLRRHERGRERVHRILDLHVLARHEEPGLVLHDRSRQGEERQEVVELQIAQPILPQPGVQRRIVDAGAVAVERRSAVVELEAPLELVPTRLGDDVGEAPLGAAELGGGAAGLDFDFLDRLDVELRPDLAGEGVGGGDAVHQRHDVGVPRSVDVRIAVPVHVGDAGSERQQVLVVAAEQRQGVDELGGEPRLRGRLLQRHDGGRGVHLDVLLQPLRLAHEGDAHHRRLPRLHGDAGEPHRREARERRADLVVDAGGKGADLEAPLEVGRRAAPLDRLVLARGGDRRPFERPPPFVGDGPSQASGGLREGSLRSRSRNQQEQNESARIHPGCPHGQCASTNDGHSIQGGTGVSDRRLHPIAERDPQPAETRNPLTHNDLYSILQDSGSLLGDS
jgi:hypothetical protein